MASRKKRDVRIRGMISAAEWDDDDNVVTIVLLSEDEEEYFIDPPHMEEKLMNFVDEDVELVGKLSYSNGDQFINVKSFRLIALHNAWLDNDDRYDRESFGGAMFSEDYEDDYSEDISEL